MCLNAIVYFTILLKNLYALLNLNRFKTYSSHIQGIHSQVFGSVSRWLDCIQSFETTYSTYVIDVGQMSLVTNFLDKKRIFWTSFGVLLGHIVYKDGILVDLANIVVIVDLPIPTSVHKLILSLGHTC